MQKQKRQWAGVTHGGKFGQRALMRIFSVVKPAALYWVLALVVPFYMLFNRKAYLAVNEYFRKQLGYSAWKAFRKTYQNHYIFGQCMFDKFAVSAGKKDFFKIKITGIEHTEKCLQNDKGLIVATSHVGNFELTGTLFQMDLPVEKNPFYLFQQQNRNFHIMVYGGETEIIMAKREQNLSNYDISLTQVCDEGMMHLFALREALQKGDIVSITCDRFTGSNKSVTCRFLSGKADFPTGAFALAVHCNVPVLTVFCMKEKRNCYHVHFKMLNVETETNLNPREKVKNYTQLYAQAIEDILQQYPEQWFNFYRFWK
jgi:predicted LPLAT superfamily acyltransferase